MGVDAHGWPYAVASNHAEAGGVGVSPTIGGLRRVVPPGKHCGHMRRWLKATEQGKGGGPRRGGERGPRTVRPWGGEPAPFYKEAYPQT
jgi:hypothetical protein